VIAAGGSKYAAVAARFGASDYAGDAEQQIRTMIHNVLHRGIDGRPRHLSVPPRHPPPRRTRPAPGSGFD
jgi:hypothetical protein